MITFPRVRVVCARIDRFPVAVESGCGAGIGLCLTAVLVMECMLPAFTMILSSSGVPETFWTKGLLWLSYWMCLSRCDFCV